MFSEDVLKKKFTENMGMYGYYVITERSQNHKLVGDERRPLGAIWVNLLSWEHLELLAQNCV